MKKAKGKGQGKAFQWLWPDVGDPNSARQAAHLGAWAALILVFVYAAVGAVTSLGDGPETGARGGDFLFAGIFALIAYGLFKLSRIAALAGICVFVGQKAYLLLEYGTRPPLTSLLFLLFFIGAARGTFRYQSLRRGDSPDENHTT